MGNLCWKLTRSGKTKTSEKSKESELSGEYGDVVIMGAESVGKTAIANRLVYNNYTEQYIPTSSETRYDVDALLEMADDEEVESARPNLILRHSFKSSEGKRHQADVHKNLQIKTPVKRVVSTNTNYVEVGRKYTEGTIRGLKSLRFSLIDMPSDLSSMQPTTYQAILQNAKGFFLVCSFDKEDSLASIEKILTTIRNTDEGPVVIIANKSDIPEADRVLDEKVVEHLAKKLSLPYCCASMSTKDGYEHMTELLLSEINISADLEEQENSTPEDYAYHNEMDEY